MKVKKDRNRMIRTQIQLTKRQVDGLKSLSSENGGSMAEWVRKAVDGLIREAGVPDWEVRKRRALAAVGIGRSDIDDVAENHDAYLEDAFDGRKS
jgi:hypothetical protein